MTSLQAPQMSDQLCFDLYAASRAVTAAYRPVLAELGLTYTQYLVLIALWERGSSSVSEIADTLQLDHGTVTPLLKRMEAQGLVERRRGHADERMVIVSLAAKGESLRQHATRIHCDMKDLLGLDETEFGQLQGTLRTLTERARS